MTVLARERRRRRREDEPEEEVERAGAAQAPPHVEAALRLQRQAGNAAVAALVQRQPRSPSLLGEGLHLDPGIEAELRRIELEQLLRRLLEPSSVRLAARDIDLKLSDPPAWTPKPGEAATAEPAPLVPRGAGPSEPREAKAGDVVDAVLAVPTVDRALDKLKTDATDRVTRDWSRLTGTDKAILITSGVAIGAGALGGALAHRESRDFLLGQISGRELPVPKLDGLNVTFTLERENVGVMFTLDVGRFLPKSAGF
jgi:hypothetical protein